MEKKHILIATAVLLAAAIVTIIAFAAIAALGAAIRYVPVQELTVEPVATIAAEVPETVPPIVATPTEEPPERPTIIANDKLDKEALKVLSGQLDCKHFYCTTYDDKWIFAFPGTERDVVLIRRPQDLMGVHDMVKKLLAVRKKEYTEDAMNFLQDRVVDRVCSYEVPNYSESKDFGLYTLTVTFTRLYDNPASGRGCFVLIEYK